MDELIKQGQWWWLLIPLGTGVFALGGSWLGAFLGRTNEHNQWLRNEKQKEYIAAIDSTSAVVETLGLLIQGKIPLRDLSDNSDFITVMNVLGPIEISRELKRFTDHIRQCSNILDEPPSEDRTRRAWGQHALVAESHTSLLRLIRKDLGVKD